MRWFRIRKAKIDPDLRMTFERYGQGCMQIVLSTTNSFCHKDKHVNISDHQDAVLLWLTEQYDKVERKETWSLTMEFAITLLVGFEVIVEILKLMGVIVKT